MSGSSGRLEKRGLDLGWLAQATSIQPGKRRNIEGVSSSSLMGLQAQLYKSQEAVRARKESGVAGSDEVYARHKGGLDVTSLMAGKNAGVEARDQKDKLHVKTGADRTSECYAALERKAALYEKLAKGHVDDDAEQYEVDFLSKGSWLGREEDEGEEKSKHLSREGPGRDSRSWVLRDESLGTDKTDSRAWDGSVGGDGYLRELDEREDTAAGSTHQSRDMGERGLHRNDEKGGSWEAVDTTGLAVCGSGAMMSSDMARERERRRWEVEEKERNKEEEEQDKAKQRRIQAVLELAKETQESRARALESKRMADEQARSKVDKLKQAFLQKQMSKFASASAKPGAARKQ